MKTSSVRFAELRRMLVDLQFTETHSDTYWRFEHPASGTVFVFRPYGATERVTAQDIAATRQHLDWRGLLKARAFDDSLKKTPA
jgi:hypothetical protein